MINIRKATVKDAEQMVDIMLKTWRSTYTGIVNESFLSEREAQREERLDRMAASIQNHHCVAELDGKIVGYAIYGEHRNEEGLSFENTGEIFAIYILKEFQKQGLGKKLVNFAASQLIEEGYKQIVIWSLKENPSRGFYKAIGGRGSLHRTFKIGEQDLEETGFVYDDISKLYNSTC
jgi:GNAT superfamily N-acetyltransferase